MRRRSHPSRVARLLAGAATAAVVASTVVVAASTPTLVAAADPLPNPTIAESCGVNVNLVLDASGSINSSHAVGDVRDAATAFLDALRNTNSNARVTQFGTASEELAPLTLVDDASLGTGGALRDALNGYYNPIPPAPAGRNFRQYNGTGNPQSTGSWGNPNTSSNQYTNWDQALHQAQTAADLVVFVTDGDPTAYDLDQPGDPFGGVSIGYNTNRGQAAAPTIDRAIDEANVVKSADTRMLAIGVGSALNSPASQQRLQEVAGPQIVRDADLATITSLNQVDVALVTDFADLAQFLRFVVLQLCSPSLTVRKLAQSASDGNYLPAPGWDITATPTTGNGQFDWILPDASPAVSKTVATNADGFAQFQWEPDPPEQDSTATVSEALQPGFTPGRPGPGNDFTCEARDQDGNVRIVNGELTVASGTASFELDPIGQEIVTCTIWNSFDYDPGIQVTKVDDPTQVRGDLDPPAVVTASYTVTNPGNTPLTLASVTDDVCATVTPSVSAPNPGDTNGDGRLDVGEAWTFSCSEAAHASIGGPPRSVTNTVTAVGVDPVGTIVSDEADDTVTIYVPGISLTKLVDGEDVVTIPLTDPLTSVVYTFEATNIGNTDLTGVTLVDDTPPCVNPTPGADPGRVDDVMQPGEAWTWSCTAAPSQSVVDTATVSGTPQIPGGAPFPDPNLPVTATDSAAVDLVNPSISLTKSVTPTLVVLGADPADSATVTYTFEASNPLQGPNPVPLNRPGASTQGPAREPGWLEDARCTAPATYVTGDANDNSLLDPGETWTFTCTGVVSQPTVNIASITGQPSDADGTSLDIPNVTDDAVAFVDVVRPGIAVDKVAIVPVVLDDDVEPVAGPDVPDVRPAQYHYEVTNTGTVALDLTPDPPVDDTCAAVTPVPASGANAGDLNSNSLLDPGETWQYTCETTLDREEDGNTPPVTGAESGTVTNVVTATGVPSLDGTLYPDKAVQATDQAQVLVIEPGLTLTKTASAPIVRAGGDVTYMFVVTNTGDVGLRLVGPIDDRCTDMTFVGGENGRPNGILDGANSGSAESWTYTCTRSIGLPEPPATTDVNTASVVGIDPLGNAYEATADAEVRVFDPAIHLHKTVSDELVLVGSTVTYTFEVTNTGRSPVSADDVLADIQLVDVAAPATPSCTSPVYVGGDTNGDGLLPSDPAETWIYQCTAAITAPTTDVGIVRGTAGTQFDPQLPVNVFAADAAFTRPFSPAIEVTKTATPTSLLGGGPVTYSYTVRNTGDVPLSNVAARITDDTCAGVTYVAGDQDGDGLLDTPTSIFEDALDEVWTFTCTTNVAVTTTNVVVVTGTPTDPDGAALCAETPCDVTDDATAVVTVTDPATIVVVKRTTEPTSTGFGFTFDAAGFTLGQDQSQTFGGLAPGTYTVTETGTASWRLTGLDCADATGDTVISLDQRRALITVAAGETVTCTFTNAPEGVLPNTGASGLGTDLGIAATLAAAGALLVVVERRRRRVIAR